MTTILFQPHLDDGVLFASYTIMREDPIVITVFAGGTVQDIPIEDRLRENDDALESLGVKEWIDWPFSETESNETGIAEKMLEVLSIYQPERVWVPLYEEDGHEQHNLVSELAFAVFEPTIVREYATYRRGSGRTRTTLEVPVYENWRSWKMRAMSFYVSQIELENTRPWFCSDDCLREWVRP